MEKVGEHLNVWYARITVLEDFRTVEERSEIIHIASVLSGERARLTSYIVKYDPVQ